MFHTKKWFHMLQIRRSVLQLLASQYYLHINHLSLRWARRPSLNCSDGKKLHHTHYSWLVPTVTACSVMCRSIWATRVRGRQVLQQVEISAAVAVLLSFEPSFQNLAPPPQFGCKLIFLSKPLAKQGIVQVLNLVPGTAP